MAHVDYLIVGQGLAGTCLALELINRKLSVHVIDKVDPNSASRVAAGLFNPITGKTMQPTWRADELFPFLKNWYAAAEEKLKDNFMHELPMFRPFVSDAERDQWHNRDHPFVVGEKPVDTSIAHAPWGALQVSNSGYLDTNQFLLAAREYLKQSASYSLTSFDFSRLNVSQSIYDGLKFSCIIFCEGVSVSQNPFFHWLPVRKLKGETLLIEIDLPTHVIFNRGVYAVPLQQKNHFKVGSTYSHDGKPGNTEAGLKELHHKTSSLFAKPFSIKATDWGHRPTSPDRRPMLGRHPMHSNMFVFNGLGTKGVSLAPFFAVQLAQHLVLKTDLDASVNIERFFSLYFQSQ